MGGKQVGYTSLLFLLKNADQFGIQVVAVFENSVSPLVNNETSTEELAKKYDIPVYRDKSNLLELPEVDFIFSIQYGQILSEAEIATAKVMAVNLHMAPLPEYRGCNQFSFAIAEGVKEFGTTLHILEAKTDAGAVLFEKRFSVSENEFVTDLYDRTVKHSIELFEQHVGDILFGNYVPIAQSKLAQSRSVSFHYRKDIHRIKQIHASWPIEKQKRYFRATYFPAFSPPVLITDKGEIPLSMEWYQKVK